MGSSEKYILYSLAVALQGSGLDDVLFKSQREQEYYLLENVLTSQWVHSTCYSLEALSEK
jgi:hypothetical protein